MAQNEQNNPLGAMISEILQDPQKLQQFRQMAASLGLSGSTANNSGGNAPDLSALLPAANNANTNNSGGNAPDLSALLSAVNNANTNNSGGNAPDLSALLSALGGASATSGKGGGLALDPGMLQKIMQAMQLFSQENPKVELLRALRPLLSEKRAKKVDDAIRIMQLMQALPMLKESGLFGKSE